MRGGATGEEIVKYKAVIIVTAFDFMLGGLRVEEELGAECDGK